MPLGEYAKGQIGYGVKTGLNEAFVVDGETRRKLIAGSPRAREIIKPLAMGKDIRKWRMTNNDRWLIYMFHGIDTRGLSAVLDHLKPHRRQLEGRATRQEWYELQQPQEAYASAFATTKIAFPDIARELRFALDCRGSYLTNTAYFLPSSDPYLLGVLNSAAVQEYYLEVSAQLRGGYVRCFRQYMERIPIPDARDSDRAAISKLVQKCLDAQGVGCEKWEKEIDERVAALYGL
jgi:hypothetical protein